MISCTSGALPNAAPPLVLLWHVPQDRRCVVPPFAFFISFRPQYKVGQAFQPDALECQAGKPDLRRAVRQSGGWLFLIAPFVLAAAGCRDGRPPENERAEPPRAATAGGPTRTARLPAELKKTIDLVPRPPRADDWFEDATERSGVRFEYHDGGTGGFYTLLETVGGGATLFDYDGDGDLDLFLGGGGEMIGPPIVVHGRRCALYRNDGKLHFTDVTDEAGLGDDRLYTHGATAADFDRDGDPDLFVAGYRGCRLYRNEGNGRFTDITEAAGLRCPDWNVAGCWADFDRDGWLDLYVMTYADCVPDARERCLNDNGMRDVCAPSSYPGSRNRVFRNRRDGTFEDMTEQAGLVRKNKGLGVVAADFDDDGWIDVFIANDAEENQLYLGGPGFKFREEGTVSGVAFSANGEREGSMGCDVGDFDADGLPDLWYANFSSQDNSLCRRNAGPGFFNVSDRTGMTGVSRPWVGFGTGFVDFDLDGWPDIAVSNGHVWYESRESPYFQPAQLFRNAEGKRFEDFSDRGGPYFSVPHAGRGFAAGDLDNDGAEDLVISRQNDPVVILRNRAAAGKPWVRVALRGTQSNPDAIGAKLWTEYRGRKLVRWVRGGGGFCAQFDSRVLFPADGPASTVTVHWPSGATESFDNLAREKTHVLVEGTGRKN